LDSNRRAGGRERSVVSGFELGGWHVVEVAVQAFGVVLVGARNVFGCAMSIVGCSLRGVSSDRSAGPVRDDFDVVRSALAERPVGSVSVVVRDVFAQQLFELPAVPEEGAVEELAAHAADPAFRVRVRDRRVGRSSDDRRAVASERSRRTS
jgi:hypothetical protein